MEVKGIRTDSSQFTLGAKCEEVAADLLSDIASELIKFFDPHGLFSLRALFKDKPPKSTVLTSKQRPLMPPKDLIWKNQYEHRISAEENSILTHTQSMLKPAEEIAAKSMLESPNEFKELIDKKSIIGLSNAGLEKLAQEIAAEHTAPRVTNKNPFKTYSERYGLTSEEVLLDEETGLLMTHTQRMTCAKLEHQEVLAGAVSDGYADIKYETLCQVNESFGMAQYSSVILAKYVQMLKNCTNVEIKEEEWIDNPEEFIKEKIENNTADSSKVPQKRKGNADPNKFRQKRKGMDELNIVLDLMIDGINDHLEIPTQVDKIYNKTTKRQNDLVRPTRTLTDEARKAVLRHILKDLVGLEVSSESPNSIAKISHKKTPASQEIEMIFQMNKNIDKNYKTKTVQEKIQAYEKMNQPNEEKTRESEIEPSEAMNISSRIQLFKELSSTSEINYYDKFKEARKKVFEESKTKKIAPTILQTIQKLNATANT